MVAPRAGAAAARAGQEGAPRAPCDGEGAGRQAPSRCFVRPWAIVYVDISGSSRRRCRGTSSVGQARHRAGEREQEPAREDQVHLKPGEEQEMRRDWDKSARSSGGLAQYASSRMPGGAASSGSDGELAAALRGGRRRVARGAVGVEVQARVDVGRDLGDGGRVAGRRQDQVRHRVAARQRQQKRRDAARGRFALDGDRGARRPGRDAHVHEAGHRRRRARRRRAQGRGRRRRGRRRGCHRRGRRRAHRRQARWRRRADGARRSRPRPPASPSLQSRRCAGARVRAMSAASARSAAPPRAAAASAPSRARRCPTPRRAARCSRARRSRCSRARRPPRGSRVRRPASAWPRGATASHRAASPPPATAAASARARSGTVPAARAPRGRRRTFRDGRSRRAPRPSRRNRRSDRRDRAPASACTSLELGRHRGVDRRRRQHPRRAHHRDGLHVGAAAEQAPQGQHLPQHHAEREDVGALIDVASPATCSGAM